MKDIQSKKFRISDEGKLTLLTGGGLVVGLEGIAHLGNTGAFLCLAGTVLAYLHGNKAIKAGSYVKGKMIDTGEASMEIAYNREIADNEMRKSIIPVRDTSKSEEVSFDPKIPNVFPQHPENETLRLGIETKKKHRFDPWINDLFGKGMIASAVQGSGKSMLCGLLIEQSAKCGVPAIIFDHKGEYSAIADLPFTNGLRAGSNVLRAKIGPSCFELSADNADDFVQTVMSERYQAIVHLPSYGDGWLDRAEIVAEVGQALMRYSTRQREAGNLLLPCLVFMDEAQLYIPQNPALLPPEAQKNKGILDSLNNAYFALVSNGRSNGYTVCFATQSLTYIAKWAIKSCQIRILMKHTEKNDLDMCEQIINPNVATREDMESMPTGTGVVFGFTQKPMVVKFDRRQSRDLSETPGIERLRIKETSQKSVQTLRLPEEALQDIGFKGTRILPESDVVAYQPAKSTQATTAAKYSKALEAYQAGNTSCRDLGAALGINKDKARVIKLDMIRLGLISE